MGPKLSKLVLNYAFFSNSSRYQKMGGLICVFWAGFFLLVGLLLSADGQS